MNQYLIGDEIVFSLLQRSTLTKENYVILKWNNLKGNSKETSGYYLPYSLPLIITIAIAFGFWVSIRRQILAIPSQYTSMSLGNWLVCTTITMSINNMYFTWFQKEKNILDSSKWNTAAGKGMCGNKKQNIKQTNKKTPKGLITLKCLKHMKKKPKTLYLNI